MHQMVVYYLEENRPIGNLLTIDSDEEWTRALSLALDLNLKPRGVAFISDKNFTNQAVNEAKSLFEGSNDINLKTEQLEFSLLFSPAGGILEYRCFSKILTGEKRSFDAKALAIEGICLPDACLLAASKLHFSTYCGIQARDPQLPKYELKRTLQ